MAACAAYSNPAHIHVVSPAVRIELEFPDFELREARYRYVVGHSAYASPQREMRAELHRASRAIIRLCDASRYPVRVLRAARVHTILIRPRASLAPADDPREAHF
jgi:hypothetical protein